MNVTVIFVLAGCTTPAPAWRSPPPSSPGPVSAPVPVRDTAPDTAPDTASSNGCPEDMVRVEDSCVDRYEAHLEGLSPYDVPTTGVAATTEGAVPQGYVSGVVAAAACAASGKRLCTSAEWLRACRGPDDTTYPYGVVYDPTACNDTRAQHPVLEVFGAATDWSDTQLNDPRLNQLPDSLAPSGSFRGCVSADGVYDLHGNLHEWVDDPDGTFLGGFYVDAVINGPGCTYSTEAHSFDYHDYSTGFRCCKEAVL